MHPFMRKIWDSLRRGTTVQTSRRARLVVELLEDRSVPTGTLSGSVFLNSLSNPLLGATISLTGTPTSGTPIIPVHLTAVTDANGFFSFSGLPDGTYQVSTGPFTGLSGNVTIGNVSASAGVSITSNAAPPSAGQNIVVQGGIDPQTISLALFFNTTTRADLPFGTAGAGAPNDTPVVSSAIGAQTLNSTTTTQTIDLAGHFRDPATTDSSITMNITANGVAKTLNVNLFDTTAPQTVANFFDYINAGDYNSSFFHRETSSSKPADLISVLQGGGAQIVNGTGPNLITPLFPTIPGEVSALNAKGTLAMANSGSANSATDQFYFNTADNPSLDSQAKFTVFGKLSNAASQTALDSLAATPVSDLHSTTFATNSPSLKVDEMPLNGGAATNFPTDASKYIVINSITTNKRDDFLTYSIVSNSSPAAVTASLTNEQLILTRVAAGSADIVVQATDRFGAIVTQTIHVTVT